MGYSIFKKSVKSEPDLRTEGFVRKYVYKLY